MPSASAKLAVANFDAQGLAGTLEGVVRQAALSSAGNAVGAIQSACAQGSLRMLHTACHGVRRAAHTPPRACMARVCMQSTGGVSWSTGAASPRYHVMLGTL